MALPAGALDAAEVNLWPFWVAQSDENSADNTAANWQALGPLFFHRQYITAPDTPPPTAGGFRPFYVEKNDPASSRTSRYFLYPIFSHHESPHGYRWSLFNLINHYRATPEKTEGNAPGAARAQPGGLDLWPFYFSRQTGDPATSYHALFPLHGTVQKRFGMDKLSWTLFPLYARAEKRNVATTSVLWPFFRTIDGDGNHGFTFWPLFGYRAKDGAYREQFYLWPLVYKDEHALWQNQHRTSFGVLPFYASHTSPEVTKKTFLGPFFGYTDRVAPVRYHETSYFWPFFVQGRGDQAYINRWGPFYTHSVIKGIDKTWVLWPLWCHKTWTDSGLHHTQNRFLWFVWNSNLQESTKNPAAPAARKTHLWPLMSYWDNGAGRKQFQTLSLFSSLFPHNEPIQLAWDPLFALYRYNQNAPDDRTHSFLWNLVSWRRSPNQREFHLGPLFSTAKGTEANRVAFGCGIIGWQRATPESRRKFFLFDFKRRPAKPASHQP